MSTQQLLKAILEKAPEMDPETVLEVLVSCNGDIDQAFKLLGITNASKQRQMTLSNIFKSGVQKQHPSKPAGPFSCPLSSQLTASNSVQAPAQATELFTPQQVKDANIDCMLIENILEPTLANTLLMELMGQSKNWSKQEFILFDRDVTSPHLSAIYTSSSNGKSVSYQGKTIDAVPFTDNLAIARDKVQQLVRKHGDPLWNSEFVVANRYDGSESGVGYHSDQLTHLGPKPIIAGLSLGASRIFRLKRRSEKKVTRQYSIHCRHNTLVIMLPGCQENWKHSIPQTKAIGSHPLTGSTRISLTFRMYPAKYAIENLPKCNCDKPMLLRTTKEEKYKYIWQCGQSYVSKQACGIVKEARDILKVPESEAAAVSE